MAENPIQQAGTLQPAPDPAISVDHMSGATDVTEHLDTNNPNSVPEIDTASKEPETHSVPQGNLPPAEANRSDISQSPVAILENSLGGSGG